MERNERIILEYFYLPLFRSLSERKWNEYDKHSFLSIFLKPQIFILSKIGKNWRE